MMSSSSFTCPEGVNPLHFSQPCVYYHLHTSEGSVLGVSMKTMSQQSEHIEPPKTDDLSRKTYQQNFGNKTKCIGQVTVGSKKNHVCIPRNSVITVLGHTNKIPLKVTCLVEQAEYHNLPLGIIVNRCVAITKTSPCQLY